MKKEVADLTEAEEEEFHKELLRLFKLGAAIQVVASQNAGEDSKGWPFITFMGEDSEIEVSLCHALEAILNFNQQKVISSLGVQAFTTSVRDIMDLAIHDALHDAFCIGLAARTMYEMNVDGLEEMLDEFDKLDPNS